MIVCRECYATGNVIGGTSAGGFTSSVGFNTGNGFISRCYSTGKVDGAAAYTGGFASHIEDSALFECYSRSAVNDSNAACKTGGFVGAVVGSAQIDDCYSTGAVFGTGTLGGFCAQNLGTITNCFWDTQTSGQATSDGGTGKTTAQMKAYATFEAVYWDIKYFDDTLHWAIGSCNDGYPCLVDTTPSCLWELLDVDTLAATDVLAHSATLNGELISMVGLSSVEVYFEYGETSGGPYTSETTHQILTEIGTFADEIFYLHEDTIHYFRAVAIGSTVYGSELSFTTSEASVLPKSITLGALSSIRLSGNGIELKLEGCSLTCGRSEDTMSLKPKEADDYE